MRSKYKGFVCFIRTVEGRKIIDLTIKGRINQVQLKRIFRYTTEVGKSLTPSQRDGLINAFTWTSTNMEPDYWGNLHNGKPLDSFDVGVFKDLKDNYLEKA